MQRPDNVKVGNKLEKPSDMQKRADYYTKNPMQPLSFTKKPMNALQALRNKAFFTERLGKKTNDLIEEAQELAEGYTATATRAEDAEHKIKTLIHRVESAYDRQDIIDYKENMDNLEQVLTSIKKDPESLTLSQLGKKEEKKEEKYDASI